MNSNRQDNKFSVFQKKPLLLLMAGIFCLGFFAVLNYYSDSLRSSVLAKTPPMVYLLLMPLFALFLSAVVWCLTHPKKSKAKNSLKSSFKFSGVLLLFLFTLFPLRWAHLSVSRSLRSFPDLSLFDFVLFFPLLSGAFLCCGYFFFKLPDKIIVWIKKREASLLNVRPSVFILCMLVISLLSGIIISYSVLDNIPHVQDSIAQLFQAKIFKTGRLWAPLPQCKEFFDYTHVINVQKWYSQYPPGHSVLLMLGLFVGAPWLVGPILGALSMGLLFLLTKEIYGDRKTTYLSCILMLFSPFYLFMSASHTNHASTMFFLLLFSYLCIGILSSYKLIYAVGAGLSLGYAFSIRPLTAFAMGAPFVLWLLWGTFKKKEIELKKAICFTAALLLMILLLLCYNNVTNGSPLTFGYEAKHQTLGFLGSAQKGPAHTLVGGLINTSNNLIGLNQYLFEWPVPSLIFIFIFFLLPVKKTKWDYLFLLSAVFLVTSYAFYYYQDLCFGPRYYYALLPFLMILTVRGILAIPELLVNFNFDRKKVTATLYILLVICMVFTVFFSIPKLVKKYSDDYWYVTDKISEAVTKKRIKNSIVFIDTWYPKSILTPNLLLYGSGFQHLSPNLDNDIIYALDLREKNIRLMDEFPERNYYLCEILGSASRFRLIKIDRKTNFGARINGS